MTISGVFTGEMTETNTCHGFLCLIVKIRIELRAVNGFCKDEEMLKYTQPLKVVFVWGVIERKRLVLPSRAWVFLKGSQSMPRVIDSYSVEV